MSISYFSGKVERSALYFAILLWYSQYLSKKERDFKKSIQ